MIISLLKKSVTLRTITKLSKTPQKSNSVRYLSSIGTVAIKSMHENAIWNLKERKEGSNFDQKN